MAQSILSPTPESKDVLIAMTLTLPRLAAKDICSLIPGLTERVLNDWNQNGYIPVRSEPGPIGGGVPRVFSLCEFCVIGLMYSAVEGLNMDPLEASLTVEDAAMDLAVTYSAALSGNTSELRTLLSDGWFALRGRKLNLCRAMPTDYDSLMPFEPIFGPVAHAMNVVLVRIEDLLERHALRVEMGSGGAPQFVN